MTVSRRDLVSAIGRVGGVAAAYRSMAAMGLLPTPAAYAGPPALPADVGKGVKVLILGAGIAGMVTALELGRVGYEVVVLEARSRPGGRNWSLRGGDVIEEIDSTQTVEWDMADHLYANPGPARLPYHHTGILSYCRELGVPLEVMCNDNRGAVMQDDAAFGGEAQHNRAVVNDIRGYVAELAAKAVAANLDLPVSVEDREKLRGFLRAFGALDRDLVYRGSGRAGYVEAPGAGTQSGTRATPLDLKQILASDFWQFKSQFGESWHQAATMMQPVGGMGRIGEAFGKRLRGLIRYESEVTQIRRTEAGAKIVWKDRKTTVEQAMEVAYVVCTLPFPVLRTIDADFSAAVKLAFAAPDYVAAGKVAFQAERRFWELDHGIYGGISWTTRDVTQVWYPTAGLHADKGILLGAYIWDDEVGNRFAGKTPSQRVADAIGDGERIHPGYARDLRHGVAVAWPKIPFTRGGWAEWDAVGRTAAYPVLLAGDGPFVFAGEHMSYVTGWQEGAVRSAHVAIGQIADKTKAARL